MAGAVQALPDGNPQGGGEAALWSKMVSGATASQISTDPAQNRHHAVPEESEWDRLQHEACEHLDKYARAASWHHASSEQTQPSPLQPDAVRR